MRPSGVFGELGLRKAGRLASPAAVTIAGHGARAVVIGLLVNIFEKKREAQNPFFSVVELTDDTTDPEVWGRNFPLQ